MPVYFSQLPEPVRKAIIALESAATELNRAERMVSDAGDKLVQARHDLANAIASVAAPV